MCFGVLKTIFFQVRRTNASHIIQGRRHWVTKKEDDKAGAEETRSSQQKASSWLDLAAKISSHISLSWPLVNYILCCSVSPWNHNEDLLSSGSKNMFNRGKPNNLKKVFRNRLTDPQSLVAIPGSLVSISQGRWGLALSTFHDGSSWGAPNVLWNLRHWERDWKRPQAPCSNISNSPTWTQQLPEIPSNTNIQRFYQHL